MTDDEGVAEAAGLLVPDDATDRQGGRQDVATEMATASRLLALRAQRLTYAQIAHEAGYADASGARQAILRALDRHEAENVVQLRSLENMALDSDERVLRSIIADRNQPAAARIRAIDARTRLSARRSRLNGMDAPIQVALSAGVVADLQDALAEAEALVRGEVLDVRDERMEG